MCWCLLYSNCNWDTHCIIVLSVFRPFCGSGFVFERTRKQKQKKTKSHFGGEKKNTSSQKTLQCGLDSDHLNNRSLLGPALNFYYYFFFFFQKITISVDIHVIYASTAIQGWIVNISHLLFVATALWPKLKYYLNKKRLMQGFFVTFISIDSQSFRNWMHSKDGGRFFSTATCNIAYRIIINLLQD
jgi:hypothetical protein